MVFVVIIDLVVCGKDRLMLYVIKIDILRCVWFGYKCYDVFGEGRDLAVTVKRCYGV